MEKHKVCFSSVSKVHTIVVQTISKKYILKSCLQRPIEFFFRGKQLKTLPIAQQPSTATSAICNMMNMTKNVIEGMAYAQTFVELFSFALTSATVQGARKMFFKNPIKSSNILPLSLLNCLNGWVAQQSNKPKE